MNYEDYDDDPPCFTGRCPKCGAFIKNEPEEGPGGYMVYDAPYDLAA